MKQKNISVMDLKEAILYVSEQMIAYHIEELRELDAAIGDGDLGITIGKGAKAVIKGITEESYERVDTLLKRIGMIFMEANPSTFAILGGTSFLYAAKVVKGKSDIAITDLLPIIQKAKEGVQKRGKAEVGDKTMIDVYEEIIIGLEEKKEMKDMNELFEFIVQLAKSGVKRTKDMISKKGRAKAFGDRTSGEIDPGSQVVYLFFYEFYQYLTNKE